MSFPKLFFIVNFVEFCSDLMSSMIVIILRLHCVNEPRSPFLQPICFNILSSALDAFISLSPLWASLSLCPFLSSPPPPSLPQSRARASNLTNTLTLLKWVVSLWVIGSVFV